MAKLNRRLGYAPALLSLTLAGCAPATSAGSGSDPWAWAMPQCVGYQPADYHTAEHRLESDLTTGEGTREQVERYESGWGERAVAEIQTVLRECASYEHGGSGDPAAFREQHLIVETGFAGDESLLVETVRQQPSALRTWCTTVVRSNDVVVTWRVELATADSGGQCAAAPAALALARTPAGEE